MSKRTMQARIPSVASSDGDGVRIQRIAGRHLNQWLDPFLMVDEIRSDDAADYIGGFPSHPHRGFETITYMLTGRMRHRDHMGNEGVIESGDVQWMTAGRGVVHSEMPEQDQGLLHGFQLWLNLPAAEKMKPAAYRDIKRREIPVLETREGARLKLIAGEVEVEGNRQRGPMYGLSTAPVIIDAHLPAHASLDLQLPANHRVLVYLYQGATREVDHRHMGAFSSGEHLHLTGTDQAADMLILAGRPLAEPIAQYGPFVMNSVEEIQQAMMDYQSGRLTG